jgi:hypothetical protein
VHLVPDSRCNGGLWLLWWGRQPVSDEQINLRPNMRIAFDGGMTFEQKPVLPGVCTTFGRFLFVFEAQIAENSGMRGVCGGDLGPAMQKPIGLVKVNCFGDVCRNHGVVLTVLPYNVHLDCQ